VFRKIVVGFDGSEGSWKALRLALALAKLQSGSEVWALSVEERLPHMPEIIDEFSEEKERQNAIFESLHREALGVAEREGVELKVETVAGHAAQAIVRFAEQGDFDLLVIGHSGRSGVWGTFLGSTAEKIVRHAKCSVLVAR
jgi:nucleotide-binding universal stress UspA family protein